jgi:hypothetical protein
MNVIADGTEALTSSNEIAVNTNDCLKYFQSKVSGGKVEVEWTFAKEHYPLPDELKCTRRKKSPGLQKTNTFFFS